MFSSFMQGKIERLVSNLKKEQGVSLQAREDLTQLITKNLLEDQSQSPE